MDSSVVVGAVAGGDDDDDDYCLPRSVASVEVSVRDASAAVVVEEFLTSYSTDGCSYADAFLASPEGDAAVAVAAADVEPYPA